MVTKAKKERPLVHRPPKREDDEWGFCRCQNCDNIDSEEEFTSTDGRSCLICPRCESTNCFLQDTEEDPDTVAYWDVDKLIKLGLSRPIIRGMVDVTVASLKHDDAVADAYRAGAEQRLGEDDKDPNKEYQAQTYWE